MSNTKTTKESKKPLSCFLEKYEGTADRTGSIAFDNDLKEKLGLISNHLNVNQKALLENIIEDWLDRYSVDIEKEVRRRVKEFMAVNRL